jgi:hypothetical protein
MIVLDVITQRRKENASGDDGGYEIRRLNCNRIRAPGFFATAMILFRVAPILVPTYRTAYGSATSGESETATPRQLFGSQEGRGEGSTSPTGSPEAQGKDAKADGGRARVSAKCARSILLSTAIA